MTRRTFSREEIDTFRQRASEAPPATQKAGITMRAAVTLLADEMIDMRDNRGYSIEALVEWWNEQEVTISMATLRKYLKEAQPSTRRRKAPPRTRADQPTPSATGDPPASPSGDPPASPSGDPPASPSGDPPASPSGDPAASPSGDPPASPHGDLPDGYRIRKDL